MAEFIRIPVICVDAISALSDSERGRLLAAVVRYASGDELEEPRGAERSLWLILKAQMDLDEQIRAGASQRKKKSRSESVTSCDMAGHGVTSCDTPSPLPSPPIPPLSISPSTEKEKPPKGGKKKAPFSPPTVEEVAAYCRERGNGIDPEAFVDHYAARGWRYNGNVAMKDWKAAVRTWERKEKAAQPEPASEAAEEFHQVTDADGRTRWVRN